MIAATKATLVVLSVIAALALEIAFLNWLDRLVGFKGEFFICLALAVCVVWYFLYRQFSAHVDETK